MLANHWSRGSWKACSKCAELIDANDRQGLLERVALIQMEIGQVPSVLLKAFHEGFFKNRKET
jgi:hypothetical protein